MRNAHRALGRSYPRIQCLKIRIANSRSLDAQFIRERAARDGTDDIGKLRSHAVDFWIKPDTSSYVLAEFHRTDEIAAAGSAAAQNVVAELKPRMT